eukprot:Protomagalhaensia_sp_Gyna_25__3793@NODE_3409_length_588_cov_2_029144_g2863_i0_p1_GENE_NODE_3409_length_588_cov_2_029144_g2863_i0NODE_3409_length_588_cov_2_029144_g2863_i0_p1_ORF_typecomplete_len145_score7_33HSA/PF07529_13/0_38HSA/PF07529_13/1_8e03MBOAT_2/PF13813_6/50MBOAT_2/PF13813_6/15_NODE_3409_length_588_cov_2_029144_g2863_i0148582
MASRESQTCPLQRSRLPLLRLVAAAQSALAESDEASTTEPPRLYLSERDWWMRQIEQTCRDSFRQKQWQLSVARQLGHDVRSHWRRRRLQEPLWKATTIASASSDFWHLQSAQLDWPTAVTQFNANCSLKAPCLKRPRSPEIET